MEAHVCWTTFRQVVPQREATDDGELRIAQFRDALGAPYHLRRHTLQLAERERERGLLAGHDSRIRSHAVSYFVLCTFVVPLLGCWPSEIPFQCKLFCSTDDIKIPWFDESTGGKERNMETMVNQGWSSLFGFWVK